MKGCILGVAALIQHGHIGLLGGENADESRSAVVSFTKVGTKTALTCLNRSHNFLLKHLVRVIVGRSRCLEPDAYKIDSRAQENPCKLRLKAS